MIRRKIKYLLRGKAVVFDICALPCDFDVERYLKLIKQTGIMFIDTSPRKLTTLNTYFPRKEEIKKYKNDRKRAINKRRS